MIFVGLGVAELPIAGDLLPTVTAAIAAEGWAQRQDALAQALAVLHLAQRTAGLPTTEGQPTEPLLGRPELGIRAPVPDLLLSAIVDPRVRTLPPGMGSLEQWVDNVRVLKNATHQVQIARAYLSTAAQPPPSVQSPI